MAIKKSEIELLANRYSKAIFYAAKTSSKLEQVNKDLADITATIEGDENFKKIIASGAIVTDKMRQIFAAIAEKSNLDQMTKHFIDILVENKRGAIIPQISGKLNNLILKESNTVKAQVTSAKKLDKAELDNVEDTLSKKLGKTIIAENVVDKNIIGGLKIKIGSTLYDDSTATKLDRLKQSLATN